MDHKINSDNKTRLKGQKIHESKNLEIVYFFCSRVSRRLTRIFKYVNFQMQKLRVSAKTIPFVDTIACTYRRNLRKEISKIIIIYYIGIYYTGSTKNSNINFYNKNPSALYAVTTFTNK